MIIEELFPTPMLRVNVESEIDLTEVEKLKRLILDKRKLIPNGGNGNYFHSNENILRSYLQESSLEKVLQKYIDVFLYQIYCEKEAKLKITNSWVNFNPTGAAHHKHFHMNSILSGVFYLQTEAKSGDFMVHKSNDIRQIYSFPFSNNKFIEKSKLFSVRNYDLHIFPSTLEHSVLQNNSKNTRISLSFNTFYYGEVMVNPKGAQPSLSRVNIKDVD